MYSNFDTLYKIANIISISAFGENVNAIIIRTLHDCPSQMNENLLISNSKLTSDANQQISVHLWGTVMLGVYYIMARIIITKYAHEFK